MVLLDAPRRCASNGTIYITLGRLAIKKSKKSKREHWKTFIVENFLRWEDPGTWQAGHANQIFGCIQEHKG